MKGILVGVFLCMSMAQAYGQGSKTEEVKFTSHNIQLSGTIVFPKDKKISAAVVFVHGSGKQTRSIHWAEKFADQGIAALVYDKRGAGKSGGEYESEQSVSEKNIVLLADDAVSALTVLSEHPALKGVPVGLAGISQAGWLIPIAAEKSTIAKFMVIWSGPICKVSEEDIYSKYTVDKDSKKIPSYNEALSAKKEKYVWPEFLGKDSDPGDSLVKLKIPGLWIFGADDGSVPVDLSIQRLKAIRELGHAYDYVLFSGVGHNNMPETFSTATDWILRTSKVK